MSALPKFSSTKPTLFWNKLCPFVHRSWIVALEKNVDLELYYISLGDDQPAWYAKDINPAETVPCLRLPDGTIIRESLFVSQYFDENYGVKGSLQAGSSLQKHQVRSFIKVLGDGVIGSLYGLLTHNDEKDTAKTEGLKKSIKEGLTQLEELYAKASPTGPFFLGENFGYADIAILPFLDRFRYTLKAFRGFDLLAGFPRLTKLVQAAEARPSFALTAQPADFYINGYASLGYASTPTVSNIHKAKLYYSDDCPFCQRVKIANVLKGSPLELVYVSLKDLEEGKAEWYTKKVPSGVVPAVELEDGTILQESLELVQFVDEFSSSVDAIGLPEGNTIQPTDAIDTYETRFLLSEFGETMGDFWGARSGDAEAGSTLLTKLGYLESYYARQTKKVEGPYFLGAKPTLADCATLPFWAGAEALHEVHLAKLPAAGGKSFAQAFPRINGSVAAIRADPKFDGIIPTKEVHVAKYKN